MGSGCVAQLVERLLPMPEVSSTNPVISKIYLYWTFVYFKLFIEKTKIKKKEAGNGPFLRKKNKTKEVLIIMVLIVKGCSTDSIIVFKFVNVPPQYSVASSTLGRSNRFSNYGKFFIQFLNSHIWEALYYSTSQNEQNWKMKVHAETAERLQWSLPA